MIYYNLQESPYQFITNDLKLYFSSERNLKLFKESYDDYIKVESYKFIRRYKITLETNFLRNFLTVSLYKKYENRGFLIESEVYQVIDNIFL